MIAIFILATFILHLYYDWNQGPVAEYKCKQWWIDNGLIDDDKAVDRKKSIYDIWFYDLSVINNGKSAAKTLLIVAKQLMGKVQRLFP